MNPDVSDCDSDSICVPKDVLFDMKLLEWCTSLAKALTSLFTKLGITFEFAFAIGVGEGDGEPRLLCEGDESGGFRTGDERLGSTKDGKSGSRSNDSSVF